MPSLGADMDFGTLVEWTVKPGDRVKRGDIIALVDTEKGLIEIEVFDGGTIESLVVTPGAKVPVGAVLAMINPDGKPGAVAAPAPQAQRPPPPPVERSKAPAPVPPARPELRPPARGLRASPFARRRAAELGIDLSAVAPSEGSVIRVADVERAGTAGTVAAPAPAPAAAGPPRVPAGYPIVLPNCRSARKCMMNKQSTVSRVLELSRRWKCA